VENVLKVTAMSKVDHKRRYWKIRELWNKSDSL